MEGNEVVLRRIGYWKDINPGYFGGYSDCTCSICGALFSDNGSFEYCPHCGAHMNGKRVKNEQHKIVSAAVKIHDFRQSKEFFIPCHRHADAYYTLKEMGYTPIRDYQLVEEGFLDNQWKFLNRSEAYARAIECNQINYKKDMELYSEDLW